MVVEVQQRNRIEELRRERGLTRSELARMAGVSVNSLLAAEVPQRSPRFETAKKIAQALGVNVVDVFVSD